MGCFSYFTSKTKILNLLTLTYCLLNEISKHISQIKVFISGNQEESTQETQQQKNSKRVIYIKGKRITKEKLKIPEDIYHTEVIVVRVVFIFKYLNEVISI